MPRFNVPDVGRYIKLRVGRKWVTGTVERFTYDEFNTSLWIETDGDEWDPPEVECYKLATWHYIKEPK